MKHAWLTDFAYPFAQPHRTRSTAFHNLVMQVVVLGYFVSTMVRALDRGADDELSAQMIARVTAMIGATVLTGVLLATGGTNMRRPISFASFAVAILAAVSAIGNGIVAVERRAVPWVDLVVVVLSTLWAWRTAEQSLAGGPRPRR